MCNTYCSSWARMLTGRCFSVMLYTYVHFMSFLIISSAYSYCSWYICKYQLEIYIQLLREFIYFSFRGCWPSCLPQADENLVRVARTTKRVEQACCTGMSVVGVHSQWMKHRNTETHETQKHMKHRNTWNTETHETQKHMKQYLCLLQVL